MVAGVAVSLADRVVAWQRVHGRHDLPWQNTQDPYRVWLSEIMLQQTQVSTVMTYYERFLTRFPTVRALAEGAQDEVLALWSGLGYYSRARNLHRCAQQVMARFGGQFPATAAALETLPGIGKSTAAAIASLCFQERVAILDGNVRRVLSRVLGFDRDLAQSAHEKALWALAQAQVPLQPVDMPVYTQGMMDLGASLCSRSRPACGLCPLSDLCVARQLGRQEAFPVKLRKLKRTAESLWLLWARNAAGQVWLCQRPERGIWAGLYCLPVHDALGPLQAALTQAGIGPVQLDPAFKHVLTHKDLHLHPVCVQLQGVAWPAGWAAETAGRWVDPTGLAALGLPAPVRKLLEQPPPAR